MDSDPRLSPPIFFNKPNVLERLDRMVGSMFLDECAKLAESNPWMDGDELEAKAEEITIHYFYLKAKERLPFELRMISWRHDLV